jgi:PAN domain
MSGHFLQALPVAVLLLIGVGGYGFIQRMQMAEQSLLQREADLTAERERQAAAEKFPSNDSRFSIMKGTAVKGDEYKSLNTTTIERCSSECAGETRCKMFAYSESSICRLFDRDFTVYENSQTQVGYLRSRLPPLVDSAP